MQKNTKKCEKYEFRKTFAEWFLAHLPTFDTKIIFGDEKWWVIDAAPIRQNSRIWSVVNPRQIDENRYQGKKKVLSWVGLLGKEILGPFWMNQTTQ